MGCRAIAILCAALFIGAGTDGSAVPPIPDRESLENLLERHASAPAFPELHDADPRALLETPRGQALYRWAKTLPEKTPQLTYSLYRMYQRTGNRAAFSELYQERRRQLTQAALLVWFEPERPAHLDRLNDLIWTICEETTWVIPPHEGPEWNIDLTNAETGAQFADVVLLLGNRLPKEIRDRMRREVDRRILQNFLEHHDSDVHWFHKGLNNWTGVCSGSIGEATLVFEEDFARQAEILSIVLAQLGRYVENGFEEDGGCLEGVGYWRYGLLHFVAFAEMLHAKTGGEVDLLAHPKMRSIAGYPLVMALGRGRFVPVADGGSDLILPPCITVPLAKKTGVAELLALTGDDESWRGRLGAGLRGLLWWDGQVPERAAQGDVVLPSSGICRLVGETAGEPIILIAKAGHNDEPHNHNDVGSFAVAVGGTTFLCDPGAGLYQRSYFDEHRYESIFTRSYGHSVPLIGGQEQPPGKQYRGEMHKPSTREVRVDLTKAYSLDTLKSAVRTLGMDAEGRLRLEDSFQFAGQPLSVQEGFMTWQPVEVDGDKARILSPSGVLALEASEGVFTAKSFDEECRANNKNGVLTRLSLDLAPALDKTVSVEMHFVPNPGPASR